MTRRLTIIAGPAVGTVYELVDGQILVIGRGADSDTTISDNRMSRVHCRVIVDGDSTSVTDAGSSSGIFVGGKKVDEQVLQPGDILIAGRTQFRYDLGDEENISGAEATISDLDVAAPAATPTASSSSSLVDLVGSTIHHYRVDEIIAKGNTGMVYLATDLKKDRVCALKVMPPTFASDDDQKAHFIRAMKTMMPIRHDHIVEIYSAGKEGVFCWVAMEYVEGISLAEVIHQVGVEGMLDWKEVWRVGVQVGRALHEASRHKVVHRNLTPVNILRRKVDRACLVGDMMLAKALEGTLAVQITKPSQLIGDVPFMSPERIQGQDNIDTRSDIYGLGATMYALLTGRPPSEGGSLPELVQNVREKEPAKPKEYQLSVDDLFQDMVMKMLAKNPDDRYDSPDQLLRELNRIGKFNSLEADWSGWQD